MVGVTKADQEDAYKQLPLAASDAATAVVTLLNPADGKFRGCVPRTQHSRSTAAAFRYECFPRGSLPWPAAS